MNDIQQKRLNSKSKKERSQKSKFEYPTSASIGFLVRATNRSFQRALEKKIMKHGITRGQWYFLRVLWEEGGLSQRELSERVGMMEPTTVIALKGMEEANLITRVRSDEDRRTKRVFLTDKGKRLRPNMLPLAKAVNETATKGLTGKDLALARRILNAMIDNLDADRD